LVPAFLRDSIRLAAGGFQAVSGNRDRYSHFTRVVFEVIPVRNMIGSAV